MAREPASIRYKNPGAMWGSALAIKWGAQKVAVKLKDGTGQNNNIAVFPTYVQGICAQLDLWRTSKHYRNKPFKDAIRVWSGGNHVESYIAFVLKRVPGMTRDTVMDDAFWRSPMGIAFLKAQAWHEAGKPYPAPAADWLEAQRRVFGSLPPMQEQHEPEIIPLPPARPPDDPGIEPVEPAKKQPWYKKAWTWISSGGIGAIGAGIWDYRVALVLGVVGLIVFGIVWFTYLRKKLERDRD